ncbi:MAG: ATPase, T2SS/T4P/T4SS family [Planctomycetota bacterium]
MQVDSNISNKKAGLFLGEWLVSRQLLTHRKLSEALSEQRRGGGRLGEVLCRLKMFSHEEMGRALAEYLSIDFVSLNDLSNINVDIARSVPESIAKRFGLIAIGEADGKIVIAMNDPLDVVGRDTVELKLKRRVKTVVSLGSEIHRAIEVVYHGSDVEEQRLRDLVKLEISTEDELGAEEKDLTTADISREVDADDAPVIRFVDLLLSQAVKSRASDIHVEPQEKSMKVRMRVDGVLCDMVPPARKMQAAVVTRIKILSNMDIAERRLPQDGRFKIKAPGRDIDVRVSSIPTIYGEKVVLRILDKTAVDHNINNIGFEPDLLRKFKAILSQPYGIIIVTGPTGSGKSTTLYSALSYLKDPRKNITTVEDPVEYRLEGINQIQIKPDIDLDFAISLRAILRQDPDIILIGEIRDKETMEIAIKASLTGHLVLSTFHTNDAPSAINRLVYMGLEPYLLASTLNLVIAQRLVRKICDKCKEPVVPDSQIIKKLKLTPEQIEGASFFHGVGCKNCGGSGFWGRSPIFEFLVVDNEIREKLVNRASEAEIRAYARSMNFGGLLESGAKKVLQGLTTVEEVLATTFAEEIE